MSPLVSVVLPVFNEEQRVGAAVRSILAQSFSDFELLVVDDGSTDATPARLAEVHDPRLHVLRLDPNGGRAAAKNHALDRARGTYVAFMDGDDEAVPHRLDAQVAFLEAHPDGDILGSALRTMGGPRSEVWRPRPDHPHIQAEFLISCAVYGATAMVRRAFLEQQAIRFVPEHYVEDYEMWTQVLHTARFANQPDVLLNHHFVPEDREEDTRAKQEAIAPVSLAQLRGLGLAPTARQQQLHSALCRPAGYHLESEADVHDCIEWVDTLTAQNRAQGGYDDAALADVLDQRMVEILASVPGHRRALARRVVHSPFVRRRLRRSVQVRARDTWTRMRRVLR